MAKYRCPHCMNTQFYANHIIRVIEYITLNNEGEICDASGVGETVSEDEPVQGPYYYTECKQLFVELPEAQEDK